MTTSASAAQGLWPFGREAPAEPVPDPVAYHLSFEVADDDTRLSSALRQASSLVSDENVPPSGVVGLLARARQDIPRLTAVLYENARYAGQIRITVDGRPLDEFSPFDPITVSPVPVAVRIEPGPAYVFGRVEAAPLPAGMSLEHLRLAPGEPAGSGKIIDAETKIVNGWRELGHPLASAGTRSVVADHHTRTLDVALVVEPGPVAEFGRVDVVGAETVDPDLIVGRAGIHGGRYSPQAVRRAEQRVRELGVFDSVRITPGDALEADGTIPLTIALSERKQRVIGAGVLYSNTEGLGAEIFWAHRNLAGGAEQLRLSFEISRLFDGAFDEPDLRLAARFHKPGVFDPMTDLTLRTELYRETTDSYRITAATAGAGLTRIFSNTLTGGLSLDVERARSEEPSLDPTDHLLTTVTSTLDWDTRDDRLDPTSGFRVQLMAAPAYDFLVEQAHASFRQDISVYRAIDQSRRFILAGRVLTGVLVVDDVLDLVANRRMYAGGSGTIRGYAYRNVAPRNADGDIIGGRSLFVVSGELRYRMTDVFGLAAFIDAGNAYASMLPKFGDLKVGVGVGVRYLTPVGPLRLDVAVPLDRGPGDPSVGVYVGLGQAF